MKVKASAADVVLFPKARGGIVGDFAYLVDSKTWKTTVLAKPTRRGTKMCHELQLYRVSAHESAIRTETTDAIRSPLPIQSIFFIETMKVILFVNVTCRNRNWSTRVTPPIGRLI